MNQLFYLSKHKNKLASWFFVIAIFISCLSTLRAVASSGVLQLAPANPHYFILHGRPTVLVGSTEHYGAVLNTDFDYVRYLDTLQRDHLNLTRLFMGPYREGSETPISDNTLAPRPQAFIAPWRRVPESANSDAQPKFDLNAWDPNYFLRLKSFLKEAQKRGIVVELSLFGTFYGDEIWKLSPMNPSNNGNATAVTNRENVYTLKDMNMVLVQEKMVEKIASEINSFDNFYYEIINEPYYAGVMLDWQRHMAQKIRAIETKLPNQHLIAQNIANGSVKVEQPDDAVSILNFHYSRPPDSVQMNYALNRAISFDETGFDGPSDAAYRVQGWDFLAAGGAVYDHLDFSFTVGKENGTYVYPPSQPGAGGPRLRKQLGFLRDVFSRVPDLLAMKPDKDLLPKDIPGGASARVLGNPGHYYLLYVHHGKFEGDANKQWRVDDHEYTLSIQCALPKGNWRVTWLNPGAGKAAKKQNMTSDGSLLLSSPAYHEDIAAIIERR